MANTLDSLPAITARDWLRILDAHGRKSGVFGLQFDQRGADATFWYSEAERGVALKIVGDITPDALAHVIALRDEHERIAAERGAEGYSAGAIMTTAWLGEECQMHGYYLEIYLSAAPWHVYAVWTLEEAEQV